MNQPTLRCRDQVNASLKQGRRTGEIRWFTGFKEKVRRHRNVLSYLPVNQVNGNILWDNKYWVNHFM